jgi:BA14K-like protein
MAFIFYFIVILVSAASVMFGIDLATSPLPSTPNVPIGRVAQAPPSAPAKPAAEHAKRAADNRALSPVYPAAPGVRKDKAAQTTGAAPKEPQQAANDTAGAKANDTWLPPPTQNAASAQPIAPQKQQATEAAPPGDVDAAKMAKNTAEKTADNANRQDDGEAQAAAAASSPHCDISACDAAYRSFRASDCTYQPYDGPRQLCTKSGGTATASLSPPPRHEPQRQAVRYRYSHYQGALPGAGADNARERHEHDTIRRIVQQMTGGEGRDIAVQDSHGQIIIVHPGGARAYGSYDDY